MSVKGYKVFNFDWSCTPDGNFKQYTCPGKFEEDGDLNICGHGMHFCEVAADCFNYYQFDSKNKVAEVIAYGDVIKDGDKSCTNKLEIVREIPWQELLVIVNTGADCTGFMNSGNRNTGNRNSGNKNSGDQNSGNWNSGDQNSGNWNSGDWNSGNGNSGDWNSGNGNSGCFCTKNQPIMFFNKPSAWSRDDWYASKARYLMNKISKKVIKWIYDCNMTDEEKEAHPEYKTTHGYLKILDETECAQTWWDGLSKEEKNIIKSLPNFDADIFKECTGIDVNANRKGE